MLGAQQPVKFEPIKAKDTANKNGVTYNVDTLLHCITGMPQYEQKSLEELRLEDYMAGRKGSTTAGGTTGGGLFAGGQATGLGGTATTGGLAGGGLFGQQNKTLGELKSVVRSVMFHNSRKFRYSATSIIQTPLSTG